MTRQFLTLATLRFAKLGLAVVALVVYGRIFGIGLQMDAWVFAWGLVAAAGMFTWGPVNEIVRSRFLQQAALSGMAEATRTATKLMRVTALGSVILALLLWFAGPWLLSLLYTNASAGGNRLVLQIFALMLPSLVLGQVLSLGSAYLNCCDVIYAPEWIGVGAALVNLVCVYGLASNLGIYALVAAQYASLLLSVLSVLVLLWRRQFLKAPWRPAVGPMVRDYLVFSAPLYFSYGAGQANGLIEKTLSSSLGVGVLSSVNYASQIKSALQAVVSSVLFSLAVPRLSQAAENGGGWLEFAIAWRDVQRVVTLFLLLVLPPVWGGADLIAAVLFDGSRVGADQLALISELIRFYLIALIPVGLYLVHGAALLAQQKGSVYAFWGVTSQALSAGCCLSLVHAMGPTVFPFALLLSHAIAAVAMARAVGPARQLWLELLKWVAALAAAGVGSLGLALWMSTQADSAMPALVLFGSAYGLVLIVGFIGYRGWKKVRR